MQNSLAEYYTLVEAFHIIAIIAWMAGMLYLPRLFVYHCDVEPGSQSSEMLKVMERRLLRFIMNPAMIAVVVLGAVLLYITGLWQSDAIWLKTKYFMVIVLLATHGFLARCRRDFAADANTRSARFYRILNEVPTVAMMTIVIMVMVKPF